MISTSMQPAKYSSDKFEQFQEEKHRMAFVNEIIPEAEKMKITFPVSTRSDGSKPTLLKWTIDREREVYLVLTKIWGDTKVRPKITTTS